MGDNSNIIRTTLLSFLKNAKTVMKENNNVLFPAFMSITSGKLSDPVPLTFSNDVEKLKTFFAIGAYCGEQKYDAVILGLMGCSRILDENNIAYYLKNLETERPTLYPQSLKNNYIVLQYVDFFNCEENEMLLCRFDVKENDADYFIPRFYGAVDSLLVSMVFDGWDSVQRN